MKITGKSYFLMGIMLLMLFVLGWSLFVMEFFESKLLPLIVGSIVLVLAAVQLGTELKTKREPEIVEDAGTAVLSDDARPYLIHGAWIAGYVLAIYVLSFTAATGLFVLFYMHRLGTRWRDAIIFAIIFTALMYGLFEVALGIDLYRGLLFNWLAG
jgi:hypothetical protein